MSKTRKQWSKTGERAGLGEKIKRSICSIFRTKIPTISHPSGISKLLMIRINSGSNDSEGRAVISIVLKPKPCRIAEWIKKKKKIVLQED